MEPKARTRILCVDDEPQVLEGLALNLRRRYDVVTAGGGAAGLELLHKDPTVAVVMSDMRMPGMDGATFLARARQAAPEAVRMLLTGQADLTSAIAAVNEGQIFRFLTKPCPPPTLMLAIDAAVEQHRLITSERVLLEQTLHGSIKTLTDVLALTSPLAFGRADRLKRLVAELAEKLGIGQRWQVEVAAMLSQLGVLTLPAETVEKVRNGRALSDAEQKMTARVPEVTEQLLANIPRLEAVREILSRSSRPYSRLDTGADPHRQLVEQGAQLLRLASDYDDLESKGNPGPRALDVLRGRADAYDPRLLEALAALRGGSGSREEVRELPLAALRVGMQLVEDAKMANGTLLVARGYEVTASFIERVRNFSAGAVKEPLRVVVRAPGQAAAA